VGDDDRCPGRFCGIDPDLLGSLQAARLGARLRARPAVHESRSRARSTARRPSLRSGMLEAQNRAHRSSTASSSVKADSSANRFIAGRDGAIVSPSSSCTPQQGTAYRAPSGADARAARSKRLSRQRHCGASRSDRTSASSRRSGPSGRITIRFTPASSSIDPIAYS
jgi:hypothetical protein